MSLKHALPRLAPRLANAAWRLAYPIFRRDEVYLGSEYSGTPENTFETIYVENRWQSEESRSGTGSTLDQTLLLRRALPKLIKARRIGTLLDAPCGDFHWMGRADLAGASYIGGDIVAPLVDALKSKYEAHGRQFIKLDIAADVLPAADLWLCRDVLFHLPNAAVLRVLRNFAQSDVRYLLTTTYPFATQNRNVRAGGFRFINLTKLPFNLPEPAWSVDDFLAPNPPRKLGLWTREEVRAALSTAAKPQRRA